MKKTIPLILLSAFFLIWLSSACIIAYKTWSICHRFDGVTPDVMRSLEETGRTLYTYDYSPFAEMLFLTTAVIVATTLFAILHRLRLSSFWRYAMPVFAGTGTAICGHYMLWALIVPYLEHAPLQTHGYELLAPYYYATSSPERFDVRGAYYSHGRFVFYYILPFILLFVTVFLIQRTGFCQRPETDGLFCANCGYNLKGLSKNGNCPECGAASI